MGCGIRANGFAGGSCYDCLKVGEDGALCPVLFSNRIGVMVSGCQGANQIKIPFASLNQSGRRYLSRHVSVSPWQGRGSDRQFCASFRIAGGARKPTKAKSSVITYRSSSISTLICVDYARLTSDH